MVTGPSKGPFRNRLKAKTTAKAKSYKNKTGAYSRNCQTLGVAPAKPRHYPTALFRHWRQLALHRDQRILLVGHYGQFIHPLLSRHPLPAHHRRGADILDGNVGPLVRRCAEPLDRAYDRVY